MKVLSLFSGIGAFESALRNMEIPFDLVGFSEIDKYATKSYCEIHNVSESLNLGDITKIDETKLPKTDLITYGFPCQDISLAGKQKGLFNDDGTKTRSGLFFDALRIIEHTQPMVAIAENVKNLTGKKFKEQFEIVLKSLENAGYNNYWKVLNAKDYGIPQNRERVFIVSIRKDVDTGIFEFPEGFPLEKRLKDLLEETVDEKYYLSDVQIDKLHLTSADRSGLKIIEDSNIIKLFDIPKEVINDNERQRRVYSSDGNSPALLNRSDSPKVLVDNSFVNGDVCKTVRAGGHGSIDRHSWDMVQHNLRIRKLTPKECFRLMGFKDEEFAKAEAVNSNTQLYKQAGNSIVVDVAEELLRKIFDCGVL